MRLQTLSWALALGLLSAHTLASTVIETGPGVKLLAHNGQEKSEGRISVEAGVQQVLVSYLVDLSKKIDKSDIQSSDTWVLTFPAGGTTVSINAPSIRSPGQFRSFNESGNWNLVNDAGLAVDFEKYRLKKDGFQFARNYEMELKKFNETQHPAAIKVQSDTSEYKPGSVVTEPEISDGEVVPMAEKMLRYWYRNADQETKARFIEWLKGQP